MTSTSCVQYEQRCPGRRVTLQEACKAVPTTVRPEPSRSRTAHPFTDRWAPWHVIHPRCPTGAVKGSAGKLL
jgi:hypothetical protein